MASYTAGAGGGNWSSSATWGGAGFPGAADTAILNAGSGSVTVDVASTCLVLNCTGYNTNLVMTSTLTMATGGTCTLPSGASGQLTGSGALILNGINALVTNGKSIPALTYGTTGTKTVTGTSDVTGLFTISTTTTQTGGVINMKGGMAVNAGLSGSSTIGIYSGTITGSAIISVNATPWSGSGAVTIAGGVTLPLFDHTSYTGTFTINSGVLFSVTGTTVLNPSATYVSGGAGASLRWSGSTGYNITPNSVVLPYDLSLNTSNIKTILGSDLVLAAGKQLTFLTSASTINSAYHIITHGQVNTAAGMSGTCTLEFGTGTIVAGGAGGSSCPIIISGDTTFTSGTTFVYGGSGSITRTGGTVTTTGATLSFISGTNVINCPGMTWGNMQAQGASTLTLSQDMVITGTLCAAGGAVLTMNGYTCTFAGSLGGASGSQGIAGTTEFIWNGTSCTWNNSSFLMNGKLTINAPSGTLTIGNCAMGSSGAATLKYISAANVVNATGSNYINLYANSTLNVNGMPAFWNTLYISNSGTYTLASDLHANTIQFVAGYTATWAGAFDIYCTNLYSVASGAGASYFMIKTGQSLNVSSIDMTAQRGMSCMIGSSTGGVKAYLNYNGTTSSMYLTRCILQDIDASGSNQPIYSWFGTLLRSVNCAVVNGKDIGGGGLTLTIT